MTVVRAQTRRRWFVVVAAAAVLCALPAIVAAVPAGSVRIALTTLTARIAASARQPYQGYAVATGSVGVPALPELGDVSSLFDGETSLRIWYASRHHWRVDTVDAAGERDIYQGGRSQTIWYSGENQLTTVVGPAPARLPRGADLAPPDLARRLLAADVPGTTVSSARPTRRIGGITAAGLRLAPADAQTTIGYVDIWADPATGLPLEVDVAPAGGHRPVLVSRMLDVSMKAPATAITTAPLGRAGIGAYVTTNPDVYGTLLDLGLGPLPTTLAGLPRTDQGLGGLRGIAAYGSGFRQIVAVSVFGRIGYEAMSGATAAGTDQQARDGETVVVSTSLLNVLIVHAYGQPYTVVAAGMVTPDVLAQAATQLIAYESQNG